jgi:hypothetical protein
MLNSIARHTWPIRILFFAVYAVLFSVQVHFKYSKYHLRNTGIDIDATTIHIAKANVSSYNKIDINFKSNKLNIKVSKRYHHKDIYEVPGIGLPDLRVFAGKPVPFTFVSVRLCHPSLISSLHRGPPAIG